MIGSSWRAALSVSHSLTQNITMSTGPMVAGSSVTLTFGSWNRLRPAFDRQPVLAHGGEMRAARDEMTRRRRP